MLITFYYYHLLLFYIIIPCITLACPPNERLTALSKRTRSAYQAFSPYFVYTWICCDVVGLKHLQARATAPPRAGVGPCCWCMYSAHLRAKNDQRQGPALWCVTHNLFFKAERRDGVSSSLHVPVWDQRLKDGLGWVHVCRQAAGTLRHADCFRRGLRLIWLPLELVCGSHEHRSAQHASTWRSHANNKNIPHNPHTHICRHLHANTHTDTHTHTHRESGHRVCVGETEMTVGSDKNTGCQREFHASDKDFLP